MKANNNILTSLKHIKKSERLKSGCILDYSLKFISFHISQMSSSKYPLFFFFDFKWSLTSVFFTDNLSAMCKRFLFPLNIIWKSCFFFLKWLIHYSMLFINSKIIPVSDYYDISTRMKTKIITFGLHFVPGQIRACFDLLPPNPDPRPAAHFL